MINGLVIGLRPLRARSGGKMRKITKLPVTKAYDGSWICYEEKDIVEACRRAGCEQEDIEECLRLFKDARSGYDCISCFYELCQMGVNNFEYRERQLGLKK